MAKYNLDDEKQLKKAIARFKALVKNGAMIEIKQRGKFPRNRTFIEKFPRNDT